jgi:hypothetical protein
MGMRVLTTITSTDGIKPIPASGTINATKANIGIACPIPVMVDMITPAVRERSESTASGMPIATAIASPE